ncbi:MAG: hypothetical protein M1832_003121 [Thelocarpon impressellum]|nr:MAG: hypothetical protein M1832_003121 [Thelocarpon impressellum]
MGTPAHRKIELQSPADLQYLHANAVRAALAKLDLHFPPAAAPPDGQEDALRRGVEEHVMAYVQRVFGHAASGIEVNGLSPSPAELQRLLDPSSNTSASEDYEPYDHRLAARIQALHASLESLTLATTALRRTAPATAAAAYKASLTKALQDEDALYTSARERPPPGPSSAAEDIGRVLQAASALEREEEVERTYARAVEGLVGLKEGLPGTVARLERAGAAAAYLEGR